FTQTVPEGFAPGRWEIRRDRCFLGPVWAAQGPGGSTSFSGMRPGVRWEEIIPRIIHLPGLRGNPERTYPVTGVGPTYPGTFDKYTASLVLHWIHKWSAQGDHTIDAL